MTLNLRASLVAVVLLYVASQVHATGASANASVSSSNELVRGAFDAGQSTLPIRALEYGMRVEPGKRYLKITEILRILNNSNPIRSVHKHKLFWLAVPAQATLISSMAEDPEGALVDAHAVISLSEERCYFSLPLPPGITKLQLEYQVAFSSVFRLMPHIPFPAESFGIVHPPSLQFKSSIPGIYVEDSDQFGEVAEVIRDASAGDAPAFIISEMPKITGHNSVSDPLSKRIFSNGTVPVVTIWGGSLTILLLGWLLYRKNPEASAKTVRTRSVSQLREELFSLEILRMNNNGNAAMGT